MRKYCNNCNENYSEDFKFCPKCGQLLEKKLSEVDEKYKDIYGYWRVTTEGDCEGRTTKTLGTFKGYIDDIALSLANKCSYSLCFTKIKEPTEEKYTDKKNKVNVQLDIDSKTWDMTSEERCEVMKELFKDRNVIIEEGDYYPSFNIIRK